MATYKLSTELSTEPYDRGLFEIYRDGKLVGWLFYMPDIYPSSPWHASMSPLRLAYAVNSCPFRAPELQAFDFNADTKEGALVEFERRGELRVNAWKELR